VSAPSTPAMSSQTFDFNHPGPSVQQLHEKQKLARLFTDALDQIQQIAPPGRYRSAAITLLEQANFLCTRSVFHNDNGTFRIESNEANECAQPMSETERPITHTCVKYYKIEQETGEREFIGSRQNALRAGAFSVKVHGADEIDIVYERQGKVQGA
jgi:hypothetical protein